MISKILASAAFAAVALTSIGTANAMPALSSPATHGNGVLEQVDFRRVCDRDGDHCRRVWVDRDHDRRPGWHRECNRFGNNCHWVRGWR